MLVAADYGLEFCLCLWPGHHPVVYFHLTALVRGPFSLPRVPVPTPSLGAKLKFKLQISALAELPPGGPAAITLPSLVSWVVCSYQERLLQTKLFY